MTSKEIREKFLKFMESKGHTIIPSSSLIPPETDPTALFTTAGMHPLVPYLMGEKHPGGRRVANSQKCIRTIDIDEIGDETHLTFFEMLGNWSFGDPDAPDGIGAGYFKKEAVEWSCEFLTSSQWLALNKNKLAVSVFAGDAHARFDEETFNIWKNLVVSEKRIARLPKKNNWWGPAGKTGPCGPDTEIFYWTGEDEAPENFDSENPLWVEIWNNVFMQFNKTANGGFEPLKQKNVDTGMGLERISMVMQNKNNVYETDLFAPVIEKIKNLSTNNQSSAISIRIVADHVKASVFIIADGVEPSNIGRGYVLRRLIRRAVRQGKLLGIEANFMKDAAGIIIDLYKDIYPELEKKKENIFEVLDEEENKFAKTLEKGLKKFDEIGKIYFNQILSKKILPGRIAFDLYQTYGFPVEMILEEARNRNMEVDMDSSEGFYQKQKQHQELSRTASAGMFKGGLADAGEQTIKYHTATHLLLAALKQVLGNHAEQKGSNITAERLRFDFSHPQKMTAEEIKKVEEIINEKIQEDLPVICEEMSLEETKTKGATGVFEQKYGEKVKVYSIGPAQGGRAFSAEICGGPHVERTGVLGKFRIKKEEASSAGVRRIKAVLE